MEPAPEGATGGPDVTAMSSIAPAGAGSIGGTNSGLAPGAKLCRASGAFDFSKGQSYGFAVGRAVDAGEAAGGVLPAGKTPAPESGAGETPGEV